MRLVQGHGINDMPWGWASENEWNKRVYRKWERMLYRCYNEEYHKTKNGKNYIGCTVCERWLTLSNFVEDFENIDGYEREKFLNGELVLDKDIKSGGKNKTYIIEQCLLTSIEENSREAMRTRDNTYLYGENHPMHGKHHTEETKQKISENNGMKGKLGSECPNSKKVAQYDKETHDLIKIWDSMHDVERELGINQGHISSCCKGKRKSAGGFVWNYVEDD